MNFNIRGEKIQLTEALKSYAEKKISKLERYFESPLTSDVNITLSVVKGLQTIEVTIPLQGLMLRAEERHTDMYAAIDLVLDKLERQIRKHKTRANRKVKQEGGLKELFRVDYSGVVAADDEEEYELVKTKSFDLKPMHVDEAILQMNMVGHNFFVFANSDTEKVNVVYKRNDGKYGLIEPAQ